MSVSISIDHVKKIYGGNIHKPIIPDLSAVIQNGEFFTLLGPSGCGKTTLLRMIAGFNSIEGGTIAFDGQIINDIPAHQRNIGMVFQSYAVFPHLTVRQNVAYGLKIRKTPRAELEHRVNEVLQAVKIEEYADRLPEQLSGGQQQRVALARAIVIRPQVLLMDEPLSNLDAKLRIEMRGTIREVQKQVGITTIYVTHDQEEALAISDRIAVMKEGIIQQVDTPQNVYERPANTFVSTFIGHSNLFYGTVKRDGTASVVFANGYEAAIPNLSASAQHGQPVIISVRPEEFSLDDTGLECKIIRSTFLGKYTNYVLAFPEGFCLEQQPTIEFSQDLGHADTFYTDGDVIRLKPNAAKINVFTADMQINLTQSVR
ncbi:MAG: ABC transporter ATP-binding protein [Treponema sp.]